MVSRSKMKNKLQFKTIAYICLYTSNTGDSVKFYRDVLGLESTNPEEDPELTTFYSFKTGETILAIEREGVRKEGMKTRAENPFLLQFKVDSPEQLEEFNKHIEQHGVKLFDRSKQTDYGIITNFCDPDGNKIEIICG